MYDSIHSSQAIFGAAIRALFFFSHFLLLFSHGNFLIVPYRSEDEHELVISFSAGRFFVIMMSKVLINQLLVIVHLI